MSETVLRPHLIEQGVHFKLTAGFVERDCIVSKNALAYLGHVQGNEIDFMDVYLSFEDNIHSVARRLVVAGESASPLILGAAYFVGVRTSVTS